MNANSTFVSMLALWVAGAIGAFGLAARASSAMVPRFGRMMDLLAFAASLAGTAALMGGILVERAQRFSQTGSGVASPDTSSAVTDDLFGGSPVILVMVFVFAFENSFAFVKSLPTRPSMSSRRLS